jgi:hypothetical protein
MEGSVNGVERGWHELLLLYFFARALFDFFFAFFGVWESPAGPPGNVIATRFSPTVLLENWPRPVLLR